jgi:hypothetical protein
VWEPGYHGIHLLPTLPDLRDRPDGEVEEPNKQQTPTVRAQKIGDTAWR